jgi:hypothetical protein
VHPELFELKALVAGRLDTHRRREIDDHLGSCADCSRHYVALMLGSSSPKTAEAEARQALVPTGTALGIGSAPASVTSYGIDAPIAPSAPRPAPRPAQSNGVALETEFPSGPARTQVPVSASLVDAIAKLRAESDAPRAVAAAPAQILIEPSIFQPTPVDGVSIVKPMATPTASELPGFMTRPASVSPSRSAAQPELVVTFSSTPSRLTSYRTPSAVGTMPGSASQYEYVSQAVPTTTAQPLPEYAFPEPTASRKPKPMTLGLVGAAAAALFLAVAGYKYFTSSVSKAAAAAAAAAAKQVEAQARTTSAPTPVVAAPAAPAQPQTRIVYVERPSRRSSDARTASDSPSGGTPAPSASSTSPTSVALPDVNLSTGASDALQANTQRNATSELTRSARPTSTRTAAPRPY